MKQILVCAVFLFLISVVIAVEGVYEPTVSVQDNPGQLIIVRIKNVDSGAPIESRIIELTSGSGSFQFSTEEDEVQISILYIKNASEFLKLNNIIKTIERGIFSTHGTISLNLKTMSFNEISPPESEIQIQSEENKTSEENISEQEAMPKQEEEPEQEEEEQKEERKVSVITGSSIFKDEEGSLSIVSYLIFSFLFILLVAFILFILKKRISKGTRWSSDESELLDAEEKLKAADKELTEIRERKKRLFEAEQKLKEDEEALRKLKRR